MTSEVGADPGLLENELDDRNGPIRAGLVLGEVRNDGSVPRVNGVSFDSHDLRCRRRYGVCADLHSDRRIRFEVVVPVGVRVAATFRGEDEDTVAFFPVYEWSQAPESRSSAGGVKDQNGLVREEATDLPCVRPELLDELGIPIRHTVALRSWTPTNPRELGTIPADCLVDR
jgi:hypothetical protein